MQGAVCTAGDRCDLDATEGHWCGCVIYGCCQVSLRYHLHATQPSVLLLCYEHLCTQKFVRAFPAAGRTQSDTAAFAKTKAAQLANARQHAQCVHMLLNPLCGSVHASQPAVLRLCCNLSLLFTFCGFCAGRMPFDAAAFFKTKS
jgi:hypothetical protein